jgi:hypothetical protein
MGRENEATFMIEHYNAAAVGCAAPINPQHPCAIAASVQNFCAHV